MTQSYECNNYNNKKCKPENITKGIRSCIKTEHSELPLHCGSLSCLCIIIVFHFNYYCFNGTQRKANMTYKKNHNTVCVGEINLYSI